MKRERIFSAHQWPSLAYMYLRLCASLHSCKLSPEPLKSLYTQTLCGRWDTRRKEWRILLTNSSLTVLWHVLDWWHKIIKFAQPCFMSEEFTAWESCRGNNSEETCSQERCLQSCAGAVKAPAATEPHHRASPQAGWKLPPASVGRREQAAC